MRVIRKIDVTPTNGVLTSINVSADATTEWTNTAKSLGDLRKVTTIANGASEATYKIYECILAHGTGQDPTLDVGIVSQFLGTYWKEISAVNEWKLFDDVPLQQTTNPGSIVAVFDAGEIVTALAVINANAATLHIEVDDPVEGIVFDQEFDLTSDRGVDNWWDFFYEPIVRWENYVVLDLPPYPDATITATLSSPSGNVLCGDLLIGQAREFGSALYGASFRLTDYSENTYDAEVGRMTFAEGLYSEDGAIDVLIQNHKFSSTKQMLKSLRNTPTVWVVDVNMPGTILFGYYRDFDLILKGPNASLCNLDIAGLT